MHTRTVHTPMELACHAAWCRPQDQVKYGAFICRYIRTYARTYTHIVHTHVHTYVHTYVRMYVRTYKCTVFKVFSGSFCYMCSGLVQWAHGCVKGSCIYVLHQYCHGVVQYWHTVLQCGCQLHASRTQVLTCLEA